MNIEDFKTRMSTDLEERVEIAPINNGNFKSEVLDATRKFHVKTSSGLHFFLIVSGLGNPQLMNRAVENIKDATTSVSPATARHILQPVASGEVENLTYAVWQTKETFPLNGRVRRFLARRRYSESILNWSGALTSETLKIADIAVSMENLKAISDDAAFPQSIKQDALSAQTRIQNGSWQPRNCFQHGDYWAGNVLLPTGPEEPMFYIIDWAGMQHDGYPFFDLARMLISMRCSRRICIHHIEKLRARVGCDHSDVQSYILSGLGYIGRNLEHFPPHRYRSMSLQVYNFMKPYQSKKLSSI